MMFWILPAILPLIGLRSESVVAAQKVNRSPKPTFNTQEIGKEDIFYSSHASRGFRAQLGVFLSDLDPSGKMANENYYPQKDHQVHKIEGKLHWSYIECYHYGFDFHSRLERVRELESQGNNRVVLMRDKKTDEKYVLKVYGNYSRYTAELNLGRLKGPYFVTPICALTVKLPIKVGGPQDNEDYEDAREYIEKNMGNCKNSEASGDLSNSKHSSSASSSSTQEDSGCDVSIILDKEYQGDLRYKFVTRPAILMEYIEGVTADIYAYKLGKAASKLSFPAEAEAGGLEKYLDAFEAQQSEAYNKLAKLIAQLFHSLTQIHGIGAVYHDLKPDNLLVVKDHLFMIDFDSMSPRTAPYRGSCPTTAPEQWQIVKGPLHSGVDFWAFGATCAILMANLCAGLYSHTDSHLSRVLREYSPLFLEAKEDNTFHFIMMPLPYVLGPIPREFLYPFFSPDPEARRFNTVELHEKIKNSAFLKNVDWKEIENPQNIPSPFPRMSGEEIRAHFLKQSDRTTFGEFEDNYKKMMMAQLLYHYSDEMEATDLEGRPDQNGDLPRKPQLVAELVGIKINRHVKSSPRHASDVRG